MIPYHGYPLSFSLPQLWRAWSVVCTHSLPSLLAQVVAKQGTWPAPTATPHLQPFRLPDQSHTCACTCMGGVYGVNRQIDTYSPRCGMKAPFLRLFTSLLLTHMGPAYTHTTRTGWETCLYKLPLKWSTQRPHVGRFCLHVMYTEEHGPPSYPQGRYLQEPLPVEGRRGSRIAKVMQ